MWIFRNVISGLSEWYSPVVPGTGLHPRPGSATSLQAYFPEIDNSWSSIWYPSRRGEDIEELYVRVAGFLDMFIPMAERRWPGMHQRILLVSHAATVISIAQTLLADRSIPLRVGCCSLSELVRMNESSTLFGGWEAKRLANGTHLKDGNMREWGLEDIKIANGKVSFSSPSLPSAGLTRMVSLGRRRSWSTRF